MKSSAICASFPPRTVPPWAALGRVPAD